MVTRGSLKSTESIYLSIVLSHYKQFLSVKLLIAEIDYSGMTTIMLSKKRLRDIFYHGANRLQEAILSAIIAIRYFVFPHDDIHFLFVFCCYYIREL